MTVVRTESVLASVAVEYYIEPNGDAKFYGGTSVIYFSPGEAVRQVTVIAKDDGVPQVSYVVSVICFSSPSLTHSINQLLNHVFFQHRYNTVKTVKSRTVLTGQKGSKSTYNCLKR